MTYNVGDFYLYSVKQHGQVDSATYLALSHFPEAWTLEFLQFFCTNAFLRPHPSHMEVPRPGTEPTPPHRSELL